MIILKAVMLIIFAVIALTYYYILKFLKGNLTKNCDICNSIHLLELSSFSCSLSVYIYH